MRLVVWWSIVAACSSTPDPIDPVAATCSDPVRGESFGRFEVVEDPGVGSFAYAAPDYRGGGLAVVDLDGDGLPELVAGSRAGGLALFRNRGDLHFELVPASGLDTTMVVTAITAIDLDNDGDRDVVIAGPELAVVMENVGTAGGPVVLREALRLTGTGATEHVLPVDLDGDGLLDLYIGNRDLDDHVASTNRICMNHGALAFTCTPGSGTGLTWATTAFDLDGDGDQDLYVANDTLVADFGRPLGSAALPCDQLLRNDGLGSDGVPQFTDVATTSGLDEPHSSMGGTLGDFDGDGQFDLYVTNLGAKKLYLGGNGSFTDRATMFDVAATQRINATCPPNTNHEGCLYLSWASVLTDFDLDGYDELLVANGLNAGSAPNLVMFTRGTDEAFREVSPDTACMDAEALVATDLDGDGDQDLVIAPRVGPIAVYENRGTPKPTSWLGVTLQGVASNREGVGAVVSVVAGGRTQRRVVGAGGIVHAVAPAEAFFGLGTAPVDSVEVTWPSGRHSVLPHPAAGPLMITEPPV